jgi:hypothetical protein
MAREAGPNPFPKDTILNERTRDSRMGLTAVLFLQYLRRKESEHTRATHALLTSQTLLWCHIKSEKNKFPPW